MKSGIREIFTCGIWNPGNFCLWNPEFGKFLLVESGIREIFAREIRNSGNFYLWNLESGKFLLVESGIWEIFAREIRNPGNFCLWNPESGKFLLLESESLALESGIQLKESGIPLTISVRNPGSTDKESEFQYQETGIHGMESRI